MHGVMVTLVRLSAAAAAIVAALVAGVGVARADGCSTPAICQYVEHVPTARGSKSTKPSRVTHTTLPTETKQALERVAPADATVLEQAATSSQFGAPQKSKQARETKATKAERRRVARKIRVASESNQSKPVQAAVGAVTETGNGRLLALVIVMSVMTAVAMAYAVLRLRRG